MITTVTLNPALDKAIYVHGLAVGDTNRIEKIELDAGGKGVNVSRMLAVLGSETFALGFIGGRVGRFIESDLAGEGFVTDFVRTQAETRTNIAIEQLAGGPPTCLNERGGPIRAHEIDELKEKVRHYASRSKVMIFGGSIPEGIEPSIYCDLIEIAKSEGALVVLDADGEPLSLGLCNCPTMIKPNIDEAKRLCCRELASVEDVAQAAEELVGRGIALVVVSMGRRGAVAATKDEVWQAIPPDVQTISTIGSGDSMVAGIAVSLAACWPISDGLALGCAAGAATAMSSGVEMGKKSDIDRLLPNVVLKRLR